MIDHARARELTGQSLDGQLSAADERELALHLVECSDCKTMYDGLHKVGGLVGTLETATWNPGELDSLISRAAAVLDGNADPAETPESEEIIVPPPAPVSPPVATDVLKIGSFEPAQPVVDPEPSKPSRAGTLVTVLVAVLALAIGAGWFLYGRDAGNVAPETTPEPESGSVIAAQIRRSFDRLESLSVNYEMSRLDAYKTERRDDNRVKYSFAAGIFDGRIAFEAPFDLRQELTFELPGDAPLKTTLVRSSAGTTTYEQTATGRTAFTDTRAPLFGFGDGSALKFGVIEAALAVSIDDLADAAEVTDAGEVDLGDGTGRLYTFNSTPSRVNHADRYEITVDEDTGLPVRISASISRENASVFTDDEVITEDQLDQAFLGKDRVSTLKLTLTEVDVNGTQVRPSDFEFEPDDDTTATTGDSDFEPIDPDTLDDIPTVATGFELVAAAENTDPATWGPDKKYPEPEENVQYAFSRGATTVIVDIRKFEAGTTSADSDADDESSPEPTTDPDSAAPDLEPGVIADDPLANIEQSSLDGFWFSTHSSLSAPVLFGSVGDRTIIVTGWASEEILAEFAQGFVSAGNPVVVSPSPDSDDSDDEILGILGTPSPAATRDPDATATP